MDPVVIGLTFLAIFVVELPDKTFLATLVLATKYRPILVWIGVGLAFAVQTTVAVLLGHAVSFLPEDVVQAAAGLMFLVGAVILIREGRSHQANEGEEVETKDVHGLQAVLASFLVLFAAEWGDLSQLLTISLVAKYEEPVSRLHRRPRRAARRQRARGGRRPAAAAVRQAARAALHRRRRSAWCWPRSRRTSCWLTALESRPMASPHGADSEVGRLQTVMLHRPGNELKRLTPRNNDRLLFDGIPWVARAQEEHDGFAAGAARPRRRGALPDRPAHRDAGRATTRATTRSPPRWPGCTSATRCAATSPGSCARPRPRS